MPGEEPDDGPDDERASDAVVAEIAAGYAFAPPVVELGALVTDGSARPDVGVRIPVSMFTRHGLVAGATGTGKTKTLQLMAEQLSTQGVPVFAADIKGDLSGLASAGEPAERTLGRAAEVGQSWRGTAYPCEFFTIGGEGIGTPVRATVSSFGPTLLSKVLGLTEVQESSLGLVFHYADVNGLPLLDIKDLRAVVQWLISADGKADLEGLGGLSKATAGVILRELIGFVDQGADQFFGEPELDSADLMRTTPDGRGVISLLELPRLSDRPAVFSTFLLWLLADLFHDLPEVGDLDRPKLVFFFDEAHLLFSDASKTFLTSVAQTVRLIRSKGIGVFFVTQQPKDVPEDVLAQLGSRIQHQLRAHTPNDAKALRQTVATYPHSSYDLEELLTQLGIGAGVVTVMDPDGVPTPVAHTRLRAPQSLMAPSPEAVLTAAIAASPLSPKYAVPLDRESAYERLATRLGAGAAKAATERAGGPAGSIPPRVDPVPPPPQLPGPPPRDPTEDRVQLPDLPRERADPKPRPEGPGAAERIFKDVTRYKTMDGMARAAGRNVLVEIARGVFGIGRRG